MYEAFYGFKEKPFSMLPDPGFLYLSKKHQSALTLLEYGLLNHVGFCVISGEAGAGKTTILRALLERIPDDITVGLITNTHQSFGGLLDWVLSAFDLHRPNLTHVEMHQIFMEYLIAQYAENRTVLLIVDEAQNMKADTLEELRMLSNVNSDKDQLMQVVLAGQPALKETLRQPDLMQFAQRVAVDYHLDSLSLEETCGYIQHRLITAGAEKDVFTPAACERIFNYSGGTPRLINLLCETVLVYGFADQQELIDVELVDEMVLERMKDSVVPIVNRDIATRAKKTDNKKLEKDFPWIRPEGGTQGLKPKHETSQREIEKVIQENVKSADIKQVAVKLDVKNVAEVAEVAEGTKSKVVATDEVAATDKQKKTEVQKKATQATTPRLSSSQQTEMVENDAAENAIYKQHPVPPVAAVDKDKSRKDLIKYAVASVVVIIIILAFVFGGGKESDPAATVADDENRTKEVQQQREKEDAQIKKLQQEAEVLKKERDEAIAKAEAEERAKKQAAEKAAVAAKTEKAKRLKQEKRRLAEAKEKERLSKKREAKAQKEAAIAKREAAVMEQERLAMQARLNEEVRLKEEQAARRLELEWQQQQRQKLDAAEKAKAIESAKEVSEAGAAAAAAAELPVKQKSAGCVGPAARFKANCR